MKIAIVGANFSPGEADRLRKAMATFRRTGQIGDFREKFIEGMIGNMYTEDFAERCFKQIEGFSDYGFPESHSASFALLAYVSSWLKCFYPDVFACALLNSQPMGFYSSSSIVRDFRDHFGETREVDINFSDWDHRLETADNRQAITDEGGGCHALRLGFRQVKDFKQEDAERITVVRGKGFDSVRDLYFRTSLSVRSIERLARADAFRSLGLNRRDALWAVQGLGAPTGERSAVEDLPLYAHALDGRFIALQNEEEIALPSMTLGEHVMEDYASLKLSLKAHPVSFAREKLRVQGVKSAKELANHPADRIVSIAGLVLVRQRPGTASGVIFATLEDETGVANVIIWPKIFEANRRTVLAARFLGVKGMLQREQSVVHVIARELTDLSAELQELGDRDPLIEPYGRPDEVKRPGSDSRNTAIVHAVEKLNRVAAVLPKGRNFH